MATPSMVKAQNLQLQMEAPLNQLEKLGALTADEADEIRNIVAEGIAERFHERYRMFPFKVERDRVQIRRDLVPKDCVLMKRFDAHSEAIRENRLPEPVAMARNYGNKMPAQPQEARDCQPSGAPRRVPTKQPLVLPGRFYRKPANPEEWAPIGKRPAPEKKPVLAHNVKPTDQKSSSSHTSTSSVKPVIGPKPSSTSQGTSTSRSRSPEKRNKNWQNGLTSKSAEDWEMIMADPYAAFNNLTKSIGPHQAQEKATTSNQSSASHFRTNKPSDQGGQLASSATPMNTPARIGNTSAARATDIVGGEVDGSKDVTVCLMDEPMLYKSDLYEPLLKDSLEEGEGDEVEVKTEEQESGVSQLTVSRPNVEFGDHLIWLDD